MFYTTQEIAEKLRIHPRSVLRLIERGEIRGTSVGRLWRIHGADFQEYIDGGSSILELEGRAEELERYKTLSALLVKLGRKRIALSYENDQVYWHGDSAAFSPTLRTAVEKSMGELKEVMERVMEGE